MLVILNFVLFFLAQNVQSVLMVNCSGRILHFPLPIDEYITPELIRKILPKDQQMPFLFSSINYEKLTDQEIVRLSDSFIAEIPTSQFGPMAIRLSQLVHEQRNFIIEWEEKKIENNNGEGMQRLQIDEPDSTEKAFPLIAIITVAAPIAQYAGGLILEYLKNRSNNDDDDIVNDGNEVDEQHQKSAYDILSKKSFDDWSIERLARILDITIKKKTPERKAETRERQIWLRILANVDSVHLLFRNLMIAQRLPFVRANQQCYDFITTYQFKNRDHRPSPKSSVGIFGCCTSISDVLDEEVDLMNALHKIADGVLDDIIDGERNPIKLAMGAFDDVGIHIEKEKEEDKEDDRYGDYGNIHQIHASKPLPKSPIKQADILFGNNDFNGGGTELRGIRRSKYGSRSTSGHSGYAKNDLHQPLSSSTSSSSSTLNEKPSKQPNHKKKKTPTSKLSSIAKRDHK